LDPTIEREHFGFMYMFYILQYHLPSSLIGHFMISVVQFHVINFHVHAHCFCNYNLLIFDASINLTFAHF